MNLSQGLMPTAGPLRHLHGARGGRPSRVAPLHGGGVTAGPVAPVRRRRHRLRVHGQDDARRRTGGRVRRAAVAGVRQVLCGCEAGAARRVGRRADRRGPAARWSVRPSHDAAARQARLVVRDTDLVSTTVYARHYYGSCPAWIEAAARRRAGDLYLLLCPDVPWVPDGLQRDRPGDAERAAMHAALPRRARVGSACASSRSADRGPTGADRRSRPSPPPFPGDVAPRRYFAGVLRGTRSSLIAAW